MKKSLNQIRVELEEIATAHDQINTFFWGDPLRAWEEMEPEYPMMNCFVPDSSMLYNETEIQFTIVVSDKHYKDWNENLNDVESDTLQIIRDVYQVINKSTRWQKFGTVESASASKFINDTGDEVAGWSMTVNFRLRDNSGVCGLPMTDYDFNREISGGCADAEYTVEYENGTEIESGTIASGASKTITVPNPSACDDATITLDGDPFITVASGATEDVTILNQNGDPVNINGTTGSEIEVQLPVTAGLAKDGQTPYGEGVSHTTLSEPNPYGNYDRFTDDLGGQTYANKILIDWNDYSEVNKRCLAYYTNYVSGAQWSASKTACAALNIAGFTGWRMWRVLEFYNLCDMSKSHTNPFPTPFTAPATYLWLLNENVADPTQAYMVAFENQISHRRFPKTSASLTTVAVRDMTVTISGGSVILT